MTSAPRTSSPPECTRTLAPLYLPRFPEWSPCVWVRMTVSTSRGNTPICLNDVFTAGHMYGVLGSTTMFLPSALMRVEVEWASSTVPSASRLRDPMQRTSS